MANVSLVNDGGGAWMFKTVRLDRNHLCDFGTTRFMKNYKIVKRDDEMQIVVSDRAGVLPSRIFSSLAVGYGGVERVLFSVNDCRSIVRDFRGHGMETGDFAAMKKLFNEMILASQDFFYLYDTDDDKRVTNFFWADGM